MLLLRVIYFRYKEDRWLKQNCLKNKLQSILTRAKLFYPLIYSACQNPTGNSCQFKCNCLNPSGKFLLIYPVAASILCFMPRCVIGTWRGRWIATCSLVAICCLGFCNHTNTSIGPQSDSGQYFKDKQFPSQSIYRINKVSFPPCSFPELGW